MNEIVGAEVDYEALFERARLAATPEACEACLVEIAQALESVTAPADQARLFLCRARVRSNQWLTREVCEDAVAAMTLFETAGDAELVVAATSLGAAHAARLGDVSLASDLTTKSVLGLDSVSDDRLRWEITNRLGIFCFSFFDYDRAVELFEVSLATAGRLGDGEKVSRQLQNLADTLLLASRQKRMSHLGTGTDKLERAEVIVRRLRLEGTADLNHRFGSHRLLAEVLCDVGRVGEALQVLDEFPGEANAITQAAQRAAVELVEARCLRLAGRVEEALAAADRGMRIGETSYDEHELMLALEELAACQEAAGDLQGALANTQEAKRHIWAMHERQTRQLVQQIWAGADLERDRRNLQTQAEDATRSAEEDDLTGIGNRRLLERFLCEEEVRQTEMACIIADIDSFKEINDTFGHEVGDAVLRQVGQLFSSKARSGQLAIRYGGMSSWWRCRASTWKLLSDSPSGCSSRSPTLIGRPSRRASTSPCASGLLAVRRRSGRRRSPPRTSDFSPASDAAGTPSLRPLQTPSPLEGGTCELRDQSEPVTCSRSCCLVFC
jgi:tetratricopeptide (TPR) repeat protein